MDANTNPGCRTGTTCFVVLNTDENYCWNHPFSFLREYYQDLAIEKAQQTAREKGFKRAVIYSPFEQDYWMAEV